MSDIVERLLRWSSDDRDTSDVIDGALTEISRLRASEAALVEALAAEREACAKVADDFNHEAQNGIKTLSDFGMAEITGRHDAFGLAARNIAIAIRSRCPAPAEEDVT
jgi:hypothetical protein